MQNLNNNPTQGMHDFKGFDALKLMIASPENILSWSHGEVMKAETINYRSHRPEPGGLMCERIFGPTKSYECYCGKYKKIRYKGVICDKCGVEVTTKSVRRERMGHIKLAAPAVHIWYAGGIPNKISLLLDIPQKKLQAVIYFSRYMVTDLDDEAKRESLIKVKEILKNNLTKIDDEVNQEIDSLAKETKDSVDSLKGGDEKMDMLIEQLDFKMRQRVAKMREAALEKKSEVEVEFKSLQALVERINIGETLSEDESNMLYENEISFFTLMMGAEAIKAMLEKLDLKKEYDKLETDMTSTSIQKRLKAVQRLRVIGGFLRNNINPVWLVIDVLPVISPDLRPIVQIAGGRFATSELNDLYRRVINRNNRLKSLTNRLAPEVILRNEKRMLQEAVDSLIDNNHRQSAPVTNNRRIPLKSLSDQIRGKQGRFRQNLLGKRVDYSGRAVIVTAGHDLKINQCGIPKGMALELFKPFVINKLIARGMATNIKSAKYIIEEANTEVWDILDQVIQNHPVLLNRAPTLHKQSIQAFYPVLIDGKAISIHPMICQAFNADFDGDQMAIHVPLADEAIQEAKDLMMPDKNILNLEYGNSWIRPCFDITQGIYYMTTIDPDIEECKSIFSSENEAVMALDTKHIKLKQKIKAWAKGEVRETCVGRIIFNEALPEQHPFINDAQNKKKLDELSVQLVNVYGATDALEILNDLNTLGFKYGTQSGYSVSLSDITPVPQVKEIIKKATNQTIENENFYQMGLMTSQEKAEKFLKIWYGEAMPSSEKITVAEMKDSNPVKAVILSGARWNSSVVNQISGLKGIVQDINMKVIEFPIVSNYYEGLNSFEYFVNCRGARKGLADTALRTSESGYLTRRLVDVAQDMIIRKDDCGTKRGFLLSQKDDEFRSLTYEVRMVGRWAAKPIVDTKTGEVIVESNQPITKELAKEIVSRGIEEIDIRSPLVCETDYGLCQKCYGYDLGTGKLIEIGKAAGILSAQSLAEPSTQMVLRTFHSGGVAARDITTGLPRIEELFEARVPKGAAIICEIDGNVTILEGKKKNTRIIRVTNELKDSMEFQIKEGDVPAFTAQKNVKPGDILIKKADKTQIICNKRGIAKVYEDKIIVEYHSVDEVEYTVAIDEELLINNGEHVSAGQLITAGNIDPKVLLETKGLMEAQRYIINNIQQAYTLQGVPMADKHLEVIISQMARYVKITDPGESHFLPGEFRDRATVKQTNHVLEKEGKKVARFKVQLLGITAASLKTESFLSAASFQEAVRVLSDAAIVGKVDHLRGLKENVMIGRLIPVGKYATMNNDELEQQVKVEITGDVPALINIEDTVSDE